jgi:signal transduction histidine kinase
VATAISNVQARSDLAASLASRVPVPLDCDVSVDRLPPAIEATAYFVIAETNVAKPGSGLLGPADRLASLGGRLAVESPAGGGTLVAADTPLTG